MVYALVYHLQRQHAPREELHATGRKRVLETSEEELMSPFPFFYEGTSVGPILKISLGVVTSALIKLVMVFHARRTALHSRGSLTLLGFDVGDFSGARREKRYMFHDDLLTAKWLGFQQDILRESISEEDIAAKPLKD